MENNQTHADNIYQELSSNLNKSTKSIKSESASEMAFGTIYVEYLKPGIFSWFLSKSNKPKNASGIKFEFDNGKKTYTKADIKKITNFSVVLSVSVCPNLIIKNNTNETFIKTTSIIKKNPATNIPDLKIFKLYPNTISAISSEYNCVYNLHDFSYASHLRHVLGLVCVSNETGLTKFIFAYNKTLLETEDVTYLLYSILCGKF
jgi:hypothetical protein